MKGFDYRKFVRGCDPRLPEEAVAHLEHCLRSLAMFYIEGWNIGDFLTAVVKNNLMDSMKRADEVNQKNVHVYCSFIYNEVPHVLVTWGREG
jgi:hypothetical protein